MNPPLCSVNLKEAIEIVKYHPHRNYGVNRFDRKKASYKSEVIKNKSVAVRLIFIIERGRKNVQQI